MSWVRLDDHFDEHPKQLRVGALGTALWTKALAYCNRQPRHDGFIATEKVESYRDRDLKDSLAVAERLVKVGRSPEGNGTIPRISRRLVEAVTGQNAID